MKKHLLLILLFILVATVKNFAQSFNSRNNYTGTWISSSSWIESTAPPVISIASNININGYITRDGSLDFASNNADKAIVIYDTLVVTGNMTFNNNAQDLVVRSGAVLIVLGNFTATNKIDLSNGGIFVVRGNLSFSNSGQDQYTGAGQLFVQGTISGSTAAQTAVNNSGSLSAQYPAIANFIAGTTSSLPVKLLSFSAKNTNRNVQLIWNTTEEKNFDFFTIERSSDYKDFTSIGTVKGSGNSSNINKYQFTDNAPLSGPAYYRLKATDYDGTHEYHQIIKVSAVKNESSTLSVYPNPLSGQTFNIQTTLLSGSFKIYNILGKTVFQSQIIPGAEFQLEKVLDPGLYIVIAENGNQKIQTKLTVK